MPLVPNLLERFLLLKLNLGPGFFLDLLSAGAFRAVNAALKLGVFEALRERPLSASELAGSINGDDRATGLLLNALEAFGYLKRRGGRFVNSALTTKWLLRDSRTSFASIIPLWDDLVYTFWRDHLEESVRKGRPSITVYEWFDQVPGRWKVFQAFTLAIARMAADEIVAEVPLPPQAQSLLDVGGGHGLYAVRFCQRYPGLKATVLDSQPALQAARDLLREEKMRSRVSLLKGDIWKDDVGGDYDVALLFNFIHAYLADENTELFRKVGAVLSPGGLLVILEQLDSKIPGRFGRGAASVFGLNYLTTLGGQMHAFEDVSEWLRAAGFAHVRRISLRKLRGSHVVLGTKVG